MSRRKRIRTRVITLAAMICLTLAAWAQDSSTPITNGETPQQEPAAAYGQDNGPAPISQNPPISGLDLPSLEPHSAPLSYIQPGATFSESADSNALNGVGQGQWASITRALGSVTLQRLWKNFDLAADYMGGIGYYDLPGQGLKQLQQADIDQKITWKRGQLSLRDTFSYLPEGNFGAAYGSEGSQGISSLGSTAFGQFWGGAALGALGLAPRMLNLSLADVTEGLTPRSSITAIGGYAFMHFYGNDVTTGGPFIGTSQVSAQVAYDRLVTSRTQLAFVYGYQGFDFSVLGTAFHSHVVQVMYGHRISGRMDFLGAVGPQITLINTQTATCSVTVTSVLDCYAAGGSLVPATAKSTSVGVAGQARLRYKLPRTSIDLWYQRYETSGSGLFAGAESDVVRLSAEHPLSRVWGVFYDIGYSRNARIQDLSLSQLASCQTDPNAQSPAPECPANNANVYSYGFLGGGVHRALGRSFHLFGSYQFNELDFGESFCSTGVSCSRISNRSVFTVGLDWTPRPIRID